MLDWLQNKTPKFIARLLHNSLFLSLCVHALGLGIVYLNLIPLSKKIQTPKAQKVVWTQTIVAKKKTPKDKLPPPDVKPKVAKKEPEKVNIEPVDKKPPKKEVKKEKPKKSRKDLMKEALANIQPDARPTPKDDNFATSDKPSPEQAYSDAQLEGIKMSPAMAAYKELIRDSIVNQFVWYKQRADYQTIIELFILEDGSIQNVTMVQSSNNDAFDQATLRAVHRASPLVAPPAPIIPLIRKESVVINFDGSQL
jgi:TonB family protein